jgi:transposase
MMGQQDRSEALFYYFRLEDQVPENHLLRLIEKHISFAFVREKLKESYSETGRPSIDPELLPTYSAELTYSADTPHIGCRAALNDRTPPRAPDELQCRVQRSKLRI